MLTALPTSLAILLALLAVAVLLHGVAVWSAFRRSRAARQPRPAGSPLPGLSLLKPLKGSEDALEANLHSFLSQEYPGPLEVVFCASEPDDPGMAVARRVAAEYPHVRTYFVHSRDGYGENPKVSNMQGGLLRASQPYVLQSDANVRLRPGYLHALMSHAVQEQADMVGSLVVGEGEQTFGALLENLQLTAFVAPAVCIAKEVANVPCIIGKSMLLRRAALNDVGGLESVRNVLAEDFMLAQAFTRAGKVISLSPLTVANVNERTSVRQFLARHARWLKMRAVIHVPAHLADPLANPTLFSLLCVLASAFAPEFVALHLAVLSYKTALDRILMRRLRGHTRPFLTLLPATQVRDLLVTGVWAYACFSRTTEWRGRKLRLGPGSRLYPVDAPLVPITVPGQSDDRREVCSATQD